MLSGGTQNTDFRGFIIQARRMADDLPVGLFLDGDDYHVLCSDDVSVWLAHVAKQLAIASCLATF